MEGFEHGIGLGQWNRILERVTLLRILDDNAESRHVRSSVRSFMYRVPRTGALTGARSDACKTIEIERVTTRRWIEIHRSFFRGN